ncbi:MULTISPECIES: hypothetical protein [Microbacterium]|uniref:Uncharacterized protein n=1 Tax=Microbacterium wangchenii TaxID=2541726 RepID=A0ABX5SWD3_9MICO|nr:MULTISPECIES: hypothetical protein [Microbacterium]MCK6065776.1 hypothetical protein [Microbacterium sp. EYE_512]QBR90092.1 hypothetical protein E4K62_16220 [Microbacterium wangchenii]
MNTQPKGAAVLDRSDVEAALARVAVAAFTYYPEKGSEEPGYAVEEDVQWAMEPLLQLNTEDRADWWQRFTAVIADPAANRRAFITELMRLAEQ